jgi:alkylation response protein AidB-like acyl-CoA dehydrogenase
MEFGFTQEQEMIRRQAEEFLKKECPISLVRELMASEHCFDATFWQKIAAMGWLGLIIPEKYGGAGLSFVEMAIVLEEMGRVLAPSAYFSTAVLAALTLLRAASEQQKSMWLKPLARGDLKATLAVNECGRRYDSPSVSVTAEPAGQDYLLNGIRLFVPDAHMSDLIICAANEGDARQGITLFAVDRSSKGLSVSPLQTMDMTRRSYEVTFENVVVPASRMLGDAGGAGPVIQKVLDAATVGLCAEMVGGSQKVLDMCVEYSKSRIQFGRPIGSFQSIQHKCADMLLATESARSAVYAAAWAASADPERVGLAASIAKAYTSDAYSAIAGEGIQIHGGMGFTWEHDAHLYFKRAKADEVRFGDASYHRERIASLIGLSIVRTPEQADRTGLALPSRV